MKARLPRIVFALTLAAASATPPASVAEESPFPLLGDVASRSHGGLAVRQAPPQVSAFDYQLGESLCSVANGSRFTAFEQHLVANGEVWYQVEVTGVTRSLAGSDCPAAPFSGWMLARTAREPLVRVLERNVATAAESAATVDTAPADPDSVEPERHPSTLAFLAKYFLLVLGTGIAVVVISMEKKGSVSPKDWLTAVTYLEFSVLGLANVLFLVLLVNARYVASDSSALTGGSAGPLFSMVKLFEASAGGFLVLGFVLTAIWMKFMSFAATR